MYERRLIVGIVCGCILGFGVSWLIVSPETPKAAASCQDEPCANPPCCNGDTNGDGAVDISDGIFLLNFLFLGGPAPEPISGGGSVCPTGLQGKWDVEVEYRPNECQVPGPLVPVSVLVEQEGCTLTVISGIDEQLQFPGVICGNIAFWSGVVPYMEAQIRMDSHMRWTEEDTIHGMTSWIIQSPLGSCRGVEVWTAHRAQ